MTFDKIAAIISEQLGIETEKIHLDSTFDDIKADSLDVVEIIMEIEDTFDISIDDDASLTTVADLVNYVEEHK